MELNSTKILRNVSQNSDCDNSSSSALDGCSSALHCQDFALQLVDIFVSAVLYSIIAIGGSLGNTLVLLVIKRNPNLQTICGVLIANLAMADLLVTAVAVPLLIQMLIRGFVPICSLNGSGFALIIVGRFSCSASLLLLAAMCVDRCWAVCYPLHHKTRMTSSKLKAVLLFIWPASLTIPILEMVLRGESRSLAVVYHMMNTGIVVCFVVFVISGLLIFRNIRSTSVKVGNMNENGGTGRVHAIMRERNEQVTKTISLVVIAFSICWIPVIYFLARRDNRYNAQNFWSLLPCLANSALNPCIYFFREKRYRQALKVLQRSSVQT